MDTKGSAVLADRNVDVCVIGGGSAGLSVASATAQLGASTVLIERGEMGGDCLNTGCVPSKALLAAAKAAHGIRTSDRFGVSASSPRVDFARVHRHVQDVIAAIAPHDSVERFEGLGVEVIKAEARFVGSRELMAGNRTIKARRVVIATGSSPVEPPIPGLDRVPFLTNQTIFDCEVLPDHLMIIGGGPIGMEMAQAFRRLGSQVTVLEASKAMSKDDPHLARILLGRLASEGVAVRQGVKVTSVEPSGAGAICLTIDEAGQAQRIEGSHLLVATGRMPNVKALDLEAAGVRHTREGITVDARLRTTAGGVYAIGDVAGGPQFTHVAGYHAGIVVQNALFYIPAKVDYASLPWVTYTDPELAQVGLTEEKAREEYGDGIRIVQVPFERNDRAQTERTTTGLAKIIARRNGKVLGASLLGPHAGELIHVWVLAIERGLKLRDVARMIAPYPTLGEINKALAGEFSKPMLFNSWTKALVRGLSWLP